jgi:hypothetical protein
MGEVDLEGVRGPRPHRDCHQFCDNLPQLPSPTSLTQTAPPPHCDACACTSGLHHMEGSRFCHDVSLACVYARPRQLVQAGGRCSEANRGGRPAPCPSLNSTRRCSAISTGRLDLALRRARACATCISTTIPHATKQGARAKVGARASRDTRTVDGRDLSRFLDGRCGARQRGTCICSRTARDEAPRSRAHAFTRPRRTQASTSRCT